MQKEVDKLRTRVATLDVTTNLPDVDITVDNLPVGKTPFPAPLIVSAGRRRVTATRPGKAPVTQVIELAGGDSKRSSAGRPRQRGVQQMKQPQRQVPATPWIITGVLGAGAIVTGSLALSASSNLKGQLSMVGTTSSAAAQQGNISERSQPDVALRWRSRPTSSSAARSSRRASPSYFTGRRDEPEEGRLRAAPPPGPQARVSLPSLSCRRESRASNPAGGFVRLEAGPESVRLSGAF